MLKIHNIFASYGGVSALNGVSLSVGSGEFVSIVGPNGAGKTTLFKVVSGIVVPMSGSILYEDKDLLAIPAHLRPHLGIAHVPEGRQVFQNLTIMENLELGACTKAGRLNWRENIEYIFQLFPVLSNRQGQQAGTLSGGQQQMLAIGRGIASSPKLLILDEPSMGLAPAVVDSIFEAIVNIRRWRGLAVLLVEQRAVEALEVCDRGYVFETGKVVLKGDRDALLSNDCIQRAYLGL